MSEAEEDFFEMANLFPADTGLPMVVWASERGHARHDVRVKVNQSHGTRMLPGNLAVVGVRPAPRLIAGNLSPADLSAVSDWIRLNETALVEYWEYRISTAQFIQQLRRLAGSGANPQRPTSGTTTVHIITWVKPVTGGCLNLSFNDDPTRIELVDLAAVLAEGGLFEPLRDPAIFARVELGANGRTVVWHLGEGVVDLDADALWLMTHPGDGAAVTE